MFVTSPFRGSNGVTSINRTARYFYQDGFTSLGAALAANPAGSTYPIAYSQSTERKNMQKGIVAGKKKNTNYYSYRFSIAYSSPYKVVIRYKVSGSDRFKVLFIDPGIGYTGGNNTGIGNPISQFLFASSDGYWTSVANRAIGANLENKAKVEVLGKARNQQLDLSESFVDIDKSVLMVAKRLGQVVKAWSEARRGDWFSVFRTLGLSTKKRRTVPEVFDVLANGWLEVSYGWLPLLADIHAGVKFVNEGLQTPAGYFTVKRRTTGSLPFCQFLANSPNNWNSWDLKSEVQRDVEVKYRLGINDPTMAFLIGVGLDNPAYLAWVGTPFSFVIDWLTPIGPWLQCFTTPLGLKFIDGYISTRTSGTIEVELKRFFALSSAQPVVWETPPSKVTQSFVELNRIALTNYPTTLPYFRLPFSNPKRIISSAALLHQARKGL